MILKCDSSISNKRPHLQLQQSKGGVQLGLTPGAGTTRLLYVIQLLLCDFISKSFKMVIDQLNTNTILTTTLKKLRFSYLLLQRNRGFKGSYHLVEAKRRRVRKRTHNLLIRPSCIFFSLVRTYVAQIEKITSLKNDLGPLKNYIRYNYLSSFFFSPNSLLSSSSSSSSSVTIN